MTTYNTYQEAKIANPTSDIYVLSRKTALMVGKFQAIDDAPTSHFSSSWTLCNPADYCMTLEMFLSDGLRLANDDIIITHDGEVATISPDKYDAANFNRKCYNDNKCYILRAAALEDKRENQLEAQELSSNSQQQLMAILNDACGVFGCIPSYLIKNIEGLITTNEEYARALSGNAASEKPKPRTKVEYVKVKFECAWHAIKAFEDGEGLYTKRTGDDFILIETAQDVLRYLYEIHRKVERPIEWWEDAIEYLEQNKQSGSCNYQGVLSVGADMTRDQWCDFARILLEQEGE